MVPSPASHPSTRGRLNGSYSLAPLHTSYQRAASRTDASQAPDHRGQRLNLGVRALGDAAEGGLEPEQSGESGRDADGPAAVTAGADGQQPARTPTAADPPEEPPGRAFEVVGIRGGAVQPGVGAVDATELAGRGLADQHGAGLLQPGRHGAVVVERSRP